MSLNKENNLIWIDLEMTGLCPEKDYILEIASIVTDSQLNIVAQGPSLTIHQPWYCLQDMNEWVKEQHTKSGLLSEVATSTISLEDAEQHTLDFLYEHCMPATSPLCGNSVGHDRAFLRIYMPRIVSFLHYRTIDVTSIKEVITRWYPDNIQAKYKKKSAHRANDDIKESIEELSYYRNIFFIKPS